MKKTAAYTTALLFIAAGALAATEALTTAQPEVIKIEVDAADLDRCRETLAQVAQMPVVTDDGSSAWFSNADDLPQVACVLRDA
ncbi:hypothetical protein [Tropicibacter oceani]|uniref:Uncharacterized protein n=1 Tax=Tropicibacter oceani TaxID=3058420 RepID=A0ABY8QGS4_9RHOB|nr:hypothetical protein [Tropicibacter oceani]WGW03832.1 hypothetical protein QF118_18245 [Tropicibacter oceani]